MNLHGNILALATVLTAGTLAVAKEEDRIGPGLWKPSAHSWTAGTLGKVVDPPDLESKPEPIREGGRWRIGVPVPMRRVPAISEPIFAEIAGGMAELRVGRTIHRDDMDWLEVNCLGVPGWVPRNRINESTASSQELLKWQMRFISPSGRVVVEYDNHIGGHGSLFVRKDGTGRGGYPLGIGYEGSFPVCEELVFSGDENYFALSHGGPSWGTEVFVFGRRGSGPFRALKLDLQERMWRLARKNGFVSATASPHHLYMPPPAPMPHGFQIELRGNYGDDNGQFHFGPFLGEWNSRGNELKMLTTKETAPPPRVR